MAIFGFDNDRPDVVIFDGLADVVGELAGRVLRGIKLSPTSTFKQDAALFAEMLSLPKAISARPNGPMVERASQFLWTRQLHPAAFSVRHVPAAFSIDAKGPTMAR